MNGPILKLSNIISMEDLLRIKRAISYRNIVFQLNKKLIQTESKKKELDIILNYLLSCGDDSLINDLYDLLVREEIKEKENQWL